MPTQPVQSSASQKSINLPIPQLLIEEAATTPIKIPVALLTTELLVNLANIKNLDQLKPLPACWTLPSGELWFINLDAKPGEGSTKPLPSEWNAKVASQAIHQTQHTTNELSLRNEDITERGVKFDPNELGLQLIGASHDGLKYKARQERAFPLPINPSDEFLDLLIKYEKNDAPHSYTDVLRFLKAANVDTSQYSIVVKALMTAFTKIISSTATGGISAMTTDIHDVLEQLGVRHLRTGIREVITTVIEPSKQIPLANKIERRPAINNIASTQALLAQIEHLLSIF